MPEYILRLIKEFMGMTDNEDIEIYNEFSLQHELGLFLRDNIHDYKVQFERNTSFFDICNLIKHEIDIVVFNEKCRYAIELKYPKNGQYPEQMFLFIKDIKFMEELKHKGFDETFCLTVVDDKNFYCGKKIDGVYSYFRDNNTIHGSIVKPTGIKKETIDIYGKYKIEWKQCNRISYYVLKLD